MDLHLNIYSWAVGYSKYWSLFIVVLVLVIVRWNKTQFKCIWLMVCSIKLNTIEYYFFIFEVFHLWPLQLLINNHVFIINKKIIFAVFLPNDISNPNKSFYPTIISLSRENIYYIILEIERLNCLTSNVLSFYFELWPSEIVLLCRLKAVRDFISIFYWHSSSCPTVDRFEDIWLQFFKVWPWSLTFRGHLRSKIFLPFESPYITPIKLLLTLSLFLVTFLRYLTSKFSEFDPDLWLSEVTWGRKYFHHSKAHTWLPI